MGVFSKLKDFFLRFLIYFVIILWPYTKLQNLFQNVEEFKNSIFKNLAFYKIKFDPKENSDLILIIFFFYSCAEFIFALLGLFNFFVGHIFSIIFFIITNFIYFNPFMDENRIKLVNTKIELFYNIGIIFSIGIVAFYPKQEEKKDDNKKIETPVNLQDDEMKKSMPVKKNKKNKKV